MINYVRALKIAIIGLLVASLSVCALLSLNIPTIPITFALFAVHLIGGLVNWKYGIVCVVIYILLGVVGVTVFAGFKGGPAVLAGPTGGYIIGYVFTVIVTGILSAKNRNKHGETMGIYIFPMLLGTTVCYIFGTIYFIILTKNTLLNALVSCVLPFLTGDVIKILLASFVLTKVRPVVLNKLKQAKIVYK